LRNPLAPIKNSVELMRRAKDNLPLIHQSRETIERQIVHLARLVDDLLDVGRISHNKLELKRQQADLALILEQAIEACRPQCDRAHHELTVSLPTQALPLQGDVVRLTQVFGNLLNNAIKFTPRGGRISLKATRQDGVAIVIVNDTGVGIPRDALTRVFDLFAQVDRGLEQETGGLGIGLSLVKRLVDMHGGSVRAYSDGAGKGSEFVVRLPLHEAAATTELAVSPGPRLSGRTRHRVLVVDDNRDGAESLAILLKMAGHETAMAFDGRAGVNAAATFRPNVVLLDIGLPKLNGYEACKAIRLLPEGPGSLIIAVTGWGQQADRIKSKEAGFSAHLTKPVDFDVLTALLETARSDRVPQQASLYTPEA
jgi:CheY-like chemotaxis protein/two-component sensor histidine kinase